MKNKLMNDKRGAIEPLNIMIGFVALVGAFAFFINQTGYGLVLIIISTLIEAIARMVK